MPPSALGELAARQRGVVLPEAPRGTLPVLLGSRQVEASWFTGFQVL